ncbi:unnamed protein product [Fusarium graminearum]|nr:unnamed protein product [Fusarium graminearum]
MRFFSIPSQALVAFLALGSVSARVLTKRDSPVLPGLWADPNIAIVNNTYYLFVTTDGFEGWGGNSFYWWKSPDLVSWTKGEKPFLVLDGKNGNVPWATGNAWAPGFAARGGKYYFYHSGNNPSVSDGHKSIGVAVASHPEGPWKAQSTPMIKGTSDEPIVSNQAIDPAAFQDPKTGKWYIYWGNGVPVVAELNDDMVSLKSGTWKRITGLQDFREGLFVNYRKGTYHLTYSIDDTGSVNYRVGYATADNPLGPWTYRGVILKKDESKGILGTGHNSVINIPGTDEWYIAYHRFHIPDGGGFRRETTIDAHIINISPGSNIVMVLCSICETIPWDNLPPTPTDEILIVSSDNAYLQEFWEWPRDCKGYSHYQSLEALNSSAEDLGCGLCRLIYKQVEFCRLKLEELQLGREEDSEFRHAWPLWEFWITKRPDGDGFWVLSYTDNNREGLVRLLAAIGINDPLSSVIAGRPVEHDGESPNAISRAIGWIDECNRHSACCHHDTLLPSRVIDVGDNRSSPYVRLWETGGIETGDYIALSYCWGKSPQYTTTKSTLNDRKRQIPISDLPQTHQDAIKLTREFGIGYLWIDSMCICQDDYDDWERESARMLSVYANAYLTINASKGNDSSSGLFYKSSTREYFEFEHTYGGIRGRALACEVPFEEAMQHAYIQLKDDPVSHRGWTLQERVLSRRTLFYSGGQMMFECNHGFRKEDGWAIDGRFPRISSQPQMVSNDQTKDTDLSVSTSELLRSWYQLLATYGGRKLTKPSDKLPAVSGLASIMAERLNDEYVAGHWRSLLITELPWQPGDCKRVPEYRAPSWSWASVDGGIGIRLKGSGYSPLAEVLDVKVNLKGTNPYGEVTEGRLLIQGPMQRLCLSTEGWDPDRPRLSSQGSLVLCTTSTYLETRPQYDFDAFADDRPRLERKFVQSLDGLELYALILLACSHGEDHYIALMIVREQGSGEYRRVGILTLTDETLGWKPGEQRKGERPIITLI